MQFKEFYKNLAILEMEFEKKYRTLKIARKCALARPCIPCIKIGTVFLYFTHVL